MNELAKRKKDLESEFDELIEMDSDIINVKSDMTISAVGVLLKNFIELSGDLLEILSKKDNYDKNLTSTIESAIGLVAHKFSNIKAPEVNVTPKISVDIKPLQNIASDISNQNKNILALVEKINNGNKSDELYKLVSTMITKQNIFLEKTFKEIDYSKELKSIGDGVNKKATQWLATVTKRGRGDLLEELVITTTK